MADTQRSRRPDHEILPSRCADRQRACRGLRDRITGLVPRPAPPQFKKAYPTRSNVERIIAWTATQHGRRIKLRYLGITKNHAWLRTRAAAINLRTLVNHGLTHRDGAWTLT